MTSLPKQNTQCINKKKILEWKNKLHSLNEKTLHREKVTDNKSDNEPGT